MPKRILLAEDSVTVTKMVQIALAHEDAVITAVKNGQEAIVAAHAARPDVALLDAVMPGKSGYEVCGELRAAGMADLPILILTGNSTPYDEARGREVAADGNLVKPFDTQALIDRIGQLCSQGRPKEGSAVRPLPTAQTRTATAAAPPAPAAAPAAPPAVARAPVVSMPAAAPPAPPPPKSAPEKPVSRSTIMGLPTLAPPPIDREALTVPSFSLPTATPPAPSPADPQRPTVEAPAPRTPAAPTLQAEAPRLVEETPPPSSRTVTSPQFAVAAPSPFAVAPPPPVTDAVRVSPDALQMPRPSLIPNAPQPRPKSTSAALRPLAAEPTAIPSTAAAGGVRAEHEAISKLSREVIEQIAWEVVPELAEQIIRAELDRLVKERAVAK